jgi:carboxyl-terminal processing protease
VVSKPKPSKMIRPFRLAATLAAALALALGVTFNLVHAEAEPLRPASHAVTSAAAHGDARRSAVTEHGDGGADERYRLDDLRVYSRVVNYVAENYVDPKRIDPKAMVIAALEQVEKTVAEVMVESDAAAGKIKVTVGRDSREFDISTLKNIYSTRPVMGDVMAFVQDHLVAHKDLREIEYAAVNGMLSTLDPHSVLLEPKFFKEMKLQTRGEFGGLGFVIAMRDGNLTVVKVLKNTPAQRAGVRAKDVITKIEEQSTINMDLQDAVDRLRGKPSTRVAITVLRTGWPEPRRMALTREVINVETVPFAKLLDKGVGYVKISQFSANTSRDLMAALNAEKVQAGGQLRGLILDLRGNPGGLLEQAIQVSDRFLSDGVIVKTVGQGERHGTYEVKEAHADRDDITGLPLVVLVNNSSASASEIVAGALKNNNRALVVGRHTFGKGSVQVLYDDFGDTVRSGESPALKLTIAQYLTPGDISIQEVGITPDVLLLPGRALKDAVNVFAPQRTMGEADLDHHFNNPSDAPSTGQRAEGRKRQEKAPFELRYLLDEKEDQVAKALKKEQQRDEMRKAHGDLEPDLTPEQMEDDEADANPDELVEDYQIRFAKDFLARYPFAERPRQLEAARTFVAERRAEEDRHLQEKLAQLGIDWSSGSSAGTPRAVVTVTPPPGKRLQAGETVPWTVTVENHGDAPFYRLRAWSLVEKDPLFDRREFVFGLVKPGEKRSWTAPLKLPKGLDSRRDEVTLHFEEDSGRAPPDVTTSLDVVEQPKPIFAFSAQVEDEATGNGDGLVERGEEIALRVDVKNEGGGTSGDKTYVSLKNLGDEKIFIKKGRAVLGALKPGEVKSATLQLEVKRGIKLEQVPLRLMVVDEKLDEYVSEKIELPVQVESPAQAATNGAVRILTAELLLRSGASAGSAPIALARRGTVLPVLARYGDFYKVEWQKGRLGFAAAADVQPVTKARREGSAVEIWQREPPRITLATDPARGAPVVDGDKWRVEGKASVPSATVAAVGNRLRDVFIFVNEQKIFFKVVPEANAALQMDFAADVPLKPGNNTVTVFAREDEDFQSRRTIVVHRRTPAEVAQGTQKAPARE